MYTIQCPTCSGAGPLRPFKQRESNGDTCSECGGTGRVTITVDKQKVRDEGQLSLRLKAESDARLFLVFVISCVIFLASPLVGLVAWLVYTGYVAMSAQPGVDRR